MLKLRNASPEEREKYFDSVSAPSISTDTYIVCTILNLPHYTSSFQVEERRVKATKDQVDKWAWQKKQYAKGEDPIDEWRKRRESGQISDLENQYGDPKEVGGKSSFI